MAPSIIIISDNAQCLLSNLLHKPKLILEELTSLININVNIYLS